MNEKKNDMLESKLLDKVIKNSIKKLDAIELSISV